MRKFVIAYHAYLWGSQYIPMICEQLRAIHNHPQDLFKRCSKLYIGVNDSSDKKPEWGVEWLNNWFRYRSSNVKELGLAEKVEIIIYPDNNEETRTLQWVRDYAALNCDDYILYFHTKGITKQNQATEDWRKYMEYFVIENWKDCIKKLDEGYDCCGVLWNRHTPIGDHSHFSGGFWWAKASYINTLDHKKLESGWRYDREFWIGSNPNVKVFEFHNSGYNDFERLITDRGHYNVEYPRSNYEKK